MKPGIAKPAPHLRVHLGHIICRRSRRVFRFSAPWMVELLHGQRITISFDPAWPEAVAILGNAEPGRQFGQIIGTAASLAPCEPVQNDGAK